MADTSQQMTAELVERIGFMSFVAMSLLILVCIVFGFFAVYTKFSTPNWQQACINAGGVPVQIQQATYDCKGI